jgi:hypothetical protein
MVTVLATPTWQLNTQQFNVLDNNGVTWGISSTTGWYDGAPVRTRTTPRSQADGDYRSRSRFGGRTLQLNGWAKAPNGALAEAARWALLALLGNDQVPLIWISDYTARYALVEVSDSSRIPPAANGAEFDFQLVLFQNDPRRFWYVAGSGLDTRSFGPVAAPGVSGGLDWSTGGGLNWSTGGGLNWGTTASTGQVTVTNPGTALAWPTLTLDAAGGTLTNPTITDTTTGYRLGYTGATMSGTDQLILNSLNKTVLRNGGDRSRELTIRQWEAIAPGATVTYALTTTNPSDTGTLTVSLTPSDR